jgi:RimJ/RimL family protein N-acetyltransferase
MAPPVTWPLRTPRLTVGRFTADDGPAFAAYRSDPAVARYQSWTAPYPVEAARTLVAEAADAPFGEPGQPMQLAVRLAGDGPPADRLVGDVYLQVLAGSPHAAELGVTLAAAHQGKGLAAEAVGAVLDAVLGPLVHKVVAYVDVRNAPSLALFDRLGFRREGHLVDSFRLDDGTFADEVLFGLTATQRPAAGLTLGPPPPMGNP